MTTIQEINWLAHMIAEDAAKAEVSAFSMPAKGNWLQLDEDDADEQLERAERYLVARGLLERNPNNPRQVRILKRPRPGRRKV